MKTASQIVFFATVGLLGLGVVAIFSAAAGVPGKFNTLAMQPIWGVIGLLACGLAMVKDYRVLRRWSIPLLGLAVLLLTAVLATNFGKAKYGATRWLIIGPIRMQPSEFAKLALIIALAHYGAYYQRYMGTFWRGLVIPGAIVAPVISLVIVEPDIGASVLMAAVAGLMLLVAGTRLRYLMAPAFLGGVALMVFLLNDPTRSARIYAWLNPEETRLGKGMQTYESLVAFSNGNLLGTGLGDSQQKLGWIPEHHTDFILPIIGEELGLIGTLLVVIGFTAIVLGGLYIAWHARETFGMLIATGISALIGFQAIINIGVVTGSLPNKGLSLPFISYGGSNMVMLMFGIGLLLNVAKHGGMPRKINEVPLPSNDSLSYQSV